MNDRKPPIDEDRARELLQRERKRIEGSLADQRRLRAGEEQEIDNEENPYSDGELIEEETVDIAVEEQLRGELEALERAEKRLQEGNYGFSVESGEPIPAQRLEAIPWAERTPEEQQRFEQTHGGASR